MTDVKLLALWTGWCDPCGEERPLALTEHGPRGPRAWLRGVGTEDRSLLLACELCGIGQHVPDSEKDDPEVSAPPVARDVQPVRAAEAEPIAVSDSLVRVLTTPMAPASVPAPRPARPTDDDTTLDLLAEGLDVITVGAR